MHFLDYKFKEIQAEKKADEQLGFINNSPQNIYGGKAIGFKFFLWNNIARNNLNLSLFVRLTSLRTTKGILKNSP